jgi:hypothetical protein
MCILIVLQMLSTTNNPPIDIKNRPIEYVQDVIDTDCHAIITVKVIDSLKMLSTDNLVLQRASMYYKRLC